MATVGVKGLTTSSSSAGELKFILKYCVIHYMRNNKHRTRATTEEISRGRLF